MLGILVSFGVRCLLVMLFLPFSALDKILNTREAVRQARRAVPVPWAATLLIFCGLGVEVIMSLGVLTGIADRLAAFILAGYCIVTALLWKQFWKSSDFRLRGASLGRDVFWDFLKNLAVAGGFLLLTFGTGAGGLGRFLADPLASSHPYATGATP